MTADDVVGRLASGMTIGIGGWGSRRKPMALVRALLRSELTDLTVVAYGGPDVGLLAAAGKIRRLIAPFATLDSIPLEPHFRAARQNGTLQLTELDEAMFMWGSDRGRSAFAVPAGARRARIGRAAGQPRASDGPYRRTGTGRSWSRFPPCVWTRRWSTCIGRMSGATASIWDPIRTSTICSARPRTPRTSRGTGGGRCGVDVRGRSRRRCW